MYMLDSAIYNQAKKMKGKCKRTDFNRSFSYYSASSLNIEYLVFKRLIIDLLIDVYF